MFDFLEALEQAKSMLTIEQVSDMLGVHHQTTRRWIKSKVIPAVLVGGTWLFDPAVLRWWYIKRSPEAQKARVSGLHKVATQNVNA